MTHNAKLRTGMKTNRRQKYVMAHRRAAREVSTIYDAESYRARFVLNGNDNLNRLMRYNRLLRRKQG